ncbi:hypothetical protein, partial [Nocardia sp. NPDC052112]|uniref:hypothetical protein n=1 Tax=Nocardia sp. NPDC052112 TaxID=3155646 RepID=UPI00344AC301
MSQEYSFDASAISAEVSQSTPLLGDATVNAQDGAAQVGQISGLEDIMNQLGGAQPGDTTTIDPQDATAQPSQTPGLDDIMNQLGGAQPGDTTTIDPQDATAQPSQTPGL